MSPAQQRLLAAWAALLSGVVCLGFLPASRLVAVLILLALLALIAALWYVASRRAEQQYTVRLDNLPDATYRQPVVLVCGDLPQAWPEQSQVLTVTQGCWIRVEDHQDVEHVARQLLWLRPDWGRQLSVMVSVCPQKHADIEVLTSRLLALRWQISQLRRETGHSVPLVLNGQAGSAMMNDMLWQAAIPGEGVSVWRESSAPSSIAAWVTTGGAMAMQQQVLMNSLMTWFHKHVKTVFMDENPDIPAVAPTAVLWGIGPILAGNLSSSIWTAWLSRHTAMQHVAGWHPVGTDSTVMSLFPDFVLPLLPEGHGLTSRQRFWRCGLTLFVVAAIAALLSSGWNNRGQEHIKVSTEYGGKSQLNLGHLVDAEKQKRGEGAELRTDDWIAVRGGKGLLLTSQTQPKAMSQQLSMDEIKQQLADALSLADSLSGLMQTAQLDPLDKSTQQNFLKQNITSLQQPVIVAGAPGGIALSTPQQIQLSANHNQILTAGGNTEISSLKRMVLAAKRGMVLFVHELGMKLVAATGKVEIQAQSDAMEITAKKGITITSTDDEILITAKKKITLQCGGSYITLDAGKIENGAGGDFKVKSANFDYAGSATLNATYPGFTACENAATEAAGKGSATVPMS